MQKEHWQAATYIAGALAVLLGAVAFNTRAELERITVLLKNAEASAAHVRTEREVIYLREPSNERRATIPQSPPANSRCIGGTLLLKEGNAWKNIGSC